MAAALEVRLAGLVIPGTAYELPAPWVPAPPAFREPSLPKSRFPADFTEYEWNEFCFTYAMTSI